MPARTYMPPEDRIATRFDIVDGGEVFREEMKHILLPQIAGENRAAVNTQGSEFYFFQRVHSGTGRRCSCWEITTDPLGICRACFGTGIVPGYRKYGFATSILDVTHPGIRAVNVLPDPRAQTGPIPFKLAATAGFGYFEAEMQLESNVGVLDAQLADYTLSSESMARIFIRSPSDSEWVPLSGSDDGAKIEARLGGRRLAFRVELWRQSPTAPLPEFRLLYLRYRQLPLRSSEPHQPACIVRADIPRTPEALTLAELGAFEAFDTRNMFLDSTLRRVTTEDFFEQIDDKRRWKVISVNSSKPMGHLVSWDVVTRNVHDYPEPYFLVP